jgi:hypothetical protein
VEGGVRGWDVSNHAEASPSRRTVAFMSTVTKAAKQITAAVVVIANDTSQTVTVDKQRVNHP